MDQTVRNISASTVERLLAKHKKKLKIRGTSGTKAGPPLKKRVTILTHFLTMTGVSTGWTVHYP
ncbi:MAG: hypothetical protein LBB80_01420 [Treponema sp.]|jgi:hypothetical protein|nr:hypothetical protein [Treponema sp.]